MPSAHFSGEDRSRPRAIVPCLVACVLCGGGAAHASSEFEGALGLSMRNVPEVTGSSQRATLATPGFFLRFGRLSLTNASGFATRQAREVERGMAAELFQGQDWRVNLALRVDSGRDSGGAEHRAVAKVPATVRARLLVRHPLGGGWQMSGAASSDLLSRGGGTQLDLGVERSWAWQPHWTVSASAGWSAADATFMRSYHGVDAEHAQASGLQQYRPGAGGRQVSLGGGLRWDDGGKWVAFGSASVGRLIGPAAASPLSHQRVGATASASLAYRF